MKMVDVTQVRTIYYEFVLATQIEILGQLLDGLEDTHDLTVVIVANGLETGDVLLGHNHDVDWCGRMNIIERDNQIILVADDDWHLVTGNFAKQTLSHFL